MAFKSVVLMARLAAILGTAPITATAETPKTGGFLTYAIPADAPPSFDAHREATFATMHSTAPFYSVLIRVNPNKPSSATDFVCDLCTEMPQPSDNGRTYAFNIREDVKFHDGSLGARRGSDPGGAVNTDSNACRAREVERNVRPNDFLWRQPPRAPPSRAHPPRWAIAVAPLTRMLELGRPQYIHLT
jgi:ABC-type transport system substrate-binding protein